MSDSLSFRHTSWLDDSISTREGQLYSKLHCLLAHVGQYLSGSIELLYSNYLPGNTISNSLLPDIHQRPFWETSEKSICGVFLQAVLFISFPHNMKSTCLTVQTLTKVSNCIVQYFSDCSPNNHSYWIMHLCISITIKINKHSCYL